MSHPTEQEIAACFFVERVLPTIIDGHLGFMAAQLVNSTIPSTREYWRRRDRRERMPVKIEANYKLPEELPLGNWTAYPLSPSAIVFACPEHEPRILVDGKLSILKPEWAGRYSPATI